MRVECRYRSDPCEHARRRYAGAGPRRCRTRGSSPALPARSVFGPTAVAETRRRAGGLPDADRAASAAGKSTASASRSEVGSAARRAARPELGAPETRLPAQESHPGPAKFSTSASTSRGGTETGHPRGRTRVEGDRAPEATVASTQLRIRTSRLEAERPNVATHGTAAGDTGCTLGAAATCTRGAETDATRSLCPTCREWFGHVPKRRTTTDALRRGDCIHAFRPPARA